MRLKRFRLAVAYWLVNQVSADDWLASFLRHAIYQRYGLTLGKGAVVSSRCHFVRPDLNNVKLGKRSFLNHGCYLENGHAIIIGSNVCIAPFVKLLTTTHDIGPAERRAGTCVRRPIRIGDGVWIGAGAVVLPGVKISEGCVIGAGALVTHDCPPNGKYLGIPARRVEELPLQQTTCIK
jgi:acetyltransferase-like isoleucine patch superfamily enzyme